jgi:hypothetical protein
LASFSSAIVACTWGGREGDVFVGREEEGRRR